jgi:hypothetical protein
MRKRGRVSPAEKQRAVNASLRYYGVPLQGAIPTTRRRSAVRSNSVPLEKTILADVLGALRMDERVALVDRRQAGTFMDGDRYVQVGTRGTLDISGMLVGGRYFEIEVKRPGKHPDENQRHRIEAIRLHGGIAGCAHSAEEALALLP